MLSLHSSPIGSLGSRNTGGMSVYVREVSQWLGRAGHRIDIFTCAGTQAPVTRLYPNVRLITLGQGRFAQISKEELPGHLPQIAQALERVRREQAIRYDLIHSHYWLSGVAGAMIQAQWQCPHLTMFHTLGAAKNRHSAAENESALRIGQEQWLTMAVDQIVAPSPSERENIIHFYSAPRSKISVIPCGVNLERFAPQDRRAARARLNLSQTAEVALFVGRFAPLKAVDALIQAMAELRPGHPGLQLLLVGGDGPQDPSAVALQQLASQLGLQDQIRFAGRVDQEALPHYYSAADLLALPSHYESFGLVVLEALACGTPVVATAVGIAANIVREGINGARIAAPLPQAIAQAIERLLRIPIDQRPAVAQVQSSVKSFGWSTVARSLAALYGQMRQLPGPFTPATAPTLDPMIRI
jgi:D-inositol-3-phosphate glycosyltransferase